MYHSITFSKTLTLYNSGANSGKLQGKNTWTDWHLIPASRPAVSPPGISTKFVEIPGLSGALDFSEYLCGRTVYGNRSGSWDFYVDNDHEDWEAIRMKVINFLHGQKLYMSFEDDSSFFWEGRFSMDEWKSEQTNSRFSINYGIKPFKIALRDMTANADTIGEAFGLSQNQGWRNTVSNMLSGISVDGSSIITVPKSTNMMALSASLYSGNAVTVDFGMKKTDLTTAKPLEIIYSDDMSGGTMTISGTGTVKFGFRERSM